MIDGQLRPAVGGGVLETVNPATEEVLGVAADATDADAAVAAARRAFDNTDWARNHEFRAHCLRQFHGAMERRLEEMRELTVAEVGAPVMLAHGAFGAQLEAPVGMVKWVADMMAGYQWSEELGVVELNGTSHRRWIEREALGVVAAITAYNFPVQLNLAKPAPSLAAGNTVVLKGAPDTPWSALALGRLIATETDIPPAWSTS